MSHDDTILVRVDECDVCLISEWKKAQLGNYGVGGIKKKIIELIKEDYRKLKSKDLKK